MLSSLVALVTGCGDKKSEAPTSTAEADRKAKEAAALEAENNAPPAPKPPPKPPKSQAEVDLTFTGAFEKKLTGPIGVCGATFIEGRIQGGNYGIRTEDFEFQVLAVSDEELAKPGVVLNIKKPTRESFLLDRKDAANKIAIDVAKGATVDVRLASMTNKTTVRVTGTITCNPDYRTR